MTKDTRDYLNRYLETLKDEHTKYSWRAIEFTIMSTISFSLMIYCMLDSRTFLASVCAFVFGYYAALYNPVRVKLIDIQDEIKGVNERLNNGNE